MQFDAATLNAHIKEMGQDFAWRRAYACPCASLASGAPDDSCEACDGKGRIWSAEVAVRIGATAQNAKKSMADFGEYQAGDYLLTIPTDQPCYQGGQHDRYRAKNSTNVFSINFRKGFRDKVRFAVKSIDRAFWLVDGEIVEGSIPTLGADGVLTWPGLAPPEGKVFSLTGVRFDEYYAYLQQPVDRNIGSVCLPRKLPARQWDLFGRSS